MKYGFVYLWYDRKHKRYYIGRHWGTEDDGYICSSRWMRNNYKKRPYDFKRRIIAIVLNKNELILEEQRWLNMIKMEECGTRYYNKTLKADTPSMRGKKHSPETIEKMSAAKRGKKMSEETKNKLRQINLGKMHSIETKEKMRKSHSRDYTDPEFRKKMSIAAKNRSTETRKKISDNSRQLIAEGKIGMKGKKHSPETIEKMKKSQQLLAMLRKGKRNQSGITLPKT